MKECVKRNVSSILRCLSKKSIGFVVKQGDIDGVISAIEAIRSRGKAAYSPACRSRALSRFRKEDRWAEYLALYEENLELRA